MARDTGLVNTYRLSAIPALGNPEHGFIYGQQFWGGEHVSFSCKPGYFLSGSSERRCLRNGTWTKEQPKCILLGKNKKYIYICYIIILYTY